MTNQQTEAKRRAIGYWFVDGLPEIAFGILLLAVSAVFGIAALTGGEASGIVVAVGLPVVLVLGVPLAGRWVRHRKRSMTYPRTGRVTYVGRSGSYTIVSRIVAVAVAVTLGWLVWHAESLLLPALLVTTGIAAALVSITLRTGLHRFAAAGAVAVVVLVASGGLLPDTSAVLASVLGITGLMLLRNGWAARLRYRREAPAPTVPEEAS
jgi:hypothetical protein